MTGSAGATWPSVFAFALLLILFWVWGTATANTLGGFIHLTLVLAMTVILARMFQPRRRGHSR